MQENTKTSTKRRLKGVVTSTKMTNTVLVKVTRFVAHPKYGKQYKQSKKYPAHCTLRDIREGERVIIEECRPLSKTQRWRVIAKV